MKIIEKLHKTWKNSVATKNFPTQPGWPQNSPWLPDLETPVYDLRLFFQKKIYIF